ncbi:hypothetical protein D3C74_241630 [compost metagenome]
MTIKDVKQSTCEACGGKLVESGDILVLGDGHELPIYKCQDCKKEANGEAAYITIQEVKR